MLDDDDITELMGQTFIHILFAVTLLPRQNVDIDIKINDIKMLKFIFCIFIIP